MPAIADPPAAAPNAAPPTPAPRQPPGLKPVPQPVAKSAREARGEALSSWMGDLGTLEPTPDDAPPGKPATDKPTKELAKPQEKPNEKPTASNEQPGTDTTRENDSTANEGEDRWPRSSQDWKRFIEVRNSNYAKRDARIKELETSLAEREAKLSAFKDAVDPKEHETVRSERDKLSETLRLAAVEKHPRFQAYYDNKISAQIELAKRISGPEKAESLATLLKMPDSDYRAAQIEALMADMSPLAQSRLGGVLNALEDIRGERENEIGRAREDLEKFTAKQTAEQKANAERAKAEAQATFEAKVKAAQKDNPLFQVREGDDAWNKEVAKRVESAKEILFGQMSREDAVQKALNAVSYEGLLQSYNDLLGELSKLKSQVEQLSSSTPGVARREQERPNGRGFTPTTKPGSRPMEAVGDWMKMLNSTDEA